MADVSRDRPTNGNTTASVEAVLEELHRVLSSTEFHSSKRCQGFLRYVVEATLSGRAEDLKERTIGIELFGRPASYEPTTDATVRVKAGEVRKRLQMYYAGAGAHDPIRIDLPAGGYVPEFTANRESEPDLPPASGLLLARRWWMWGLLAAAGVAALAVAAIMLRAPGPGDEVLRRFWQPALRTGTPVLLSLSQVPVYGLDPDVEVSGKPPARVDDFVLLEQQFVGGGDVVGLGRLTAMLSELGQKYRVRLGNQVSFHDLRESPSVLLGYSYTEWNQLNRGLRFLIDTSVRPPAITDNGRRTAWALHGLHRDRTTDSDYAIVCRLMHRDTGALLVILAGITQFGTEAAAELVTDPDRLASALRGLPEGWETKNLQLVLQVRVISGVPATPSVIATHSW